jgi:hypothetical protein
MRTKSIGGFGTTCDVGLTGIVRDESSLSDELVHARVGSPVTRPSRFGGTVQDVLDRQIDFVTCHIPCHLDPIPQGGECPMCPTTSTILRNMLLNV